MKTFLEYLIEQSREFRRTDKYRSVHALHASGAYEPDSEGHIHFTTYHGGNFGEGPDESPTVSRLATTPQERIDFAHKRANDGISITPNQPNSSYFGLSTTPDATAAREYRVYQSVREPKKNEHLYELHGRVHRDNVKKFDDYSGFDKWHSAVHEDVRKILQKDEHYMGMSKVWNAMPRPTGHTPPEREQIKNSQELYDKMNSYQRNITHKHITDTLGVHVAIIGTGKGWGAGSGRAKKSGEIMIYKPHGIIHSITKRTSDVDSAREAEGIARNRLIRWRERKRDRAYGFG